MKKLFLKMTAGVMGGIFLTVPICVNSTDVFASTGGKTADDAISWVKSKVGIGIDYDGLYGNQCVDLIKAYYEYLGQRPQSGNGADYTYNPYPDGWNRYKGVHPEKGDILVYTGGYGGYGHVAIYESDNVTYHQNFGSKMYVQKVDIKYNGNMGVVYWGVIRPDFAKSSGIVSVTGVSLNASNATISVGQSKQLVATVSPSSATNKKVTWSSSNSKVAKVDSSGKVTAVGSGTAVITAKTANGGKTAKCNVTVPYTGVRFVNGGWVYYRNGKPDYSFTGVAKSTKGNWIFVRNGRYAPSFTGVAKSTKGNWIFVRNGRFDASFTGVAKSTKGNWIFVRNGRYVPSFTGVAKSTKGNWLFVRNGRYTSSFTGVAKSTKGNWVYVKKGRFDASFTGIAPVVNSSKKYYVVKGYWKKSYSGKIGNSTIKNGVVV